MTFDELIQKMQRKVEIIVGFPKDKQVTYPPDDRKGHRSKGGQTVAQVATWNEYGVKKRNIPSRPFLRTALKKNKREIVRIMGNYYKTKNLDDPTYLDKVGIIVKDMVRDSILNGNWVNNAPATIRRKKSNRPLIDRGIMKNSVMYEVKVS